MPVSRWRFLETPKIGRTCLVPAAQILLQTELGQFHRAVDVSHAPARIHVGLQGAEVHAGSLAYGVIGVVENDGADPTRIVQPGKSSGDNTRADVVGTE